MVVHDEGKFDPSSIPLQTWESYESELWERGSNQSIGSIIEAARADKSRGGSRSGSQYAPSLYGQPMMPQTQSYMNHSPSPSNYGGGSQVGGYFPQPDARQSMFSMPGVGQQYPGHMSGYGTPAMSVYGAPAATHMSGYGTPGGFMGQPQGYSGFPTQFQQSTPSIYGGSQMGGVMGGGFASGAATPAAMEHLVDVRSGAGVLPSDEVIKRDIRQRE